MCDQSGVGECKGYTIPRSIAQHLCMLQHNATTSIIYIPSIMLAALGGQFGYNNLGVILVRDSN